MPLVSVVIPAYNHGKYVRETLQSILDQTFQDFEVIIINNGSSDNTGEEIQKFKDPRIQLLSFSKNQGAVVAANYGSMQATGKYIAMTCSDDLFMPDKLEKQVNYMEIHPETAVVLSQAAIIDEESNPFLNTNHFYFNIFNKENRSRFEWLKYFFYHENCLCHPSALVRKTIHQEINGHHPCYAQLSDFDFWVRICLKHDIYIMQEKLVKYRIRNSEMNTSGYLPENRIRTEWEHAHILKHFFTLPSLEDLLKIFPELKNDYTDFDEALIPFYVAMLCLKTKSTAHHYAALEALQDLLLTSAQRLEEKVNFSYPDFFKLVGKYDIFHQQAKLAYERMLNSRSWKITKPLRWLKKLYT